MIVTVNGYKIEVRNAGDVFKTNDEIASMLKDLRARTRRAAQTPTKARIGGLQAILDARAKAPGGEVDPASDGKLAAAAAVAARGAARIANRKPSARAAARAAERKSPAVPAADSKASDPAGVVPGRQV